MLASNELAAWWQFENGHAPTLGSFGTTSHGTSTYTAARFGLGRVFDQDNRIACDSSVIPTGAKTMEMVIATHDAWSSSNGFVYGTARNSSDYGARFFLRNNGVLQFSGFKGGGAGNYNLEYQLALNSEYHVCGVWDGTTSTNGVKLYVDGELVQAGTSNTSNDGNSRVLTIGGRDASNFLYTKCTISRISIWSAALTQEQVRSLCNDFHPVI